MWDDNARAQKKGNVNETKRIDNEVFGSNRNRSSLRVTNELGRVSVIVQPKLLTLISHHFDGWRLQHSYSITVIHWHPHFTFNPSGTAIESAVSERIGLKLLAECWGILVSPSCRCCCPISFLFIRTRTFSFLLTNAYVDIIFPL